MKNLEIAKILYEIAEMLEMLGIAFKPRAYQKAARSIEGMSEDIVEVYKNGKLEDIPGVGKHIAEKIVELIKTGRLKYYSDLKKKIPVKVDELMGISGLGPKRIMLLYKKLHVRNLKDLERAAKSHKIQHVEGLGVKVEEDIINAIEFSKKKTGRFLLGYIMPAAEEIKSEIKKLDGVKQVEVAGSYRRRKETVGDIDILVTSTKPKKVMDYFIGIKDIDRVLASGLSKSMIRLKNGLEIDVRVLKDEEYGSALQYFTGNKDHNIVLRNLALKKGYTLSEYGLFKLKGKKWVAGRTEQEIYNKLGLQLMPPEMRENTGEIEAAQRKELPRVIDYNDVKGDLQMHSDWSDGVNKIEEMVLEAKKLGMKFIAITDHVGQIGIVHPLDETRLERQFKIIDKISDKLGIRIFKGAEVDILKNGRLALSRKMQNKLDIVLASIHSAFKMSEQEMTSRICRALEKDRVHIFAHPTGRLLQQREAYAVNFPTLFNCARKNNVFLEINCHPERMDLNGELIKAAKNVGCRFSLGTDSHNKEGLKYLQLGVSLARRGWLEAKDVLNTYSVDRIEKVLKGK